MLRGFNNETVEETAARMVRQRGAGNAIKCAERTVYAYDPGSPTREHFVQVSRYLKTPKHEDNTR